MRIGILSAIMFSLVCGSAAAAMTLDDVTVGTTVVGPKLKKDELKGKVVFVEFWGVNCPPCRALMPKLAELHKKYENQGFHILGFECQGSSSSTITDLCKQNGVAYQVTSGGQLKGSNVSGIPHGFLFDAEGKLIADNPHGEELENKVKELIKDTNAAMTGPGPYKKLAPMAAQIKTGMGLGTVLKTIEGKKTSKDAEEASEATMMYDSLSAAGKEQLERAIKSKDTDALAAVTKLDKLAVQFTGNEIATKAKAESDNLKKDPKVKKEIEAGSMLKTLATMEDGLKPVKGVSNPKDESFRKINMQAIGTIVGGCQSIVQRYPGTSAASKAEEMMSQYK